MRQAGTGNPGRERPRPRSIDPEQDIESAAMNQAYSSHYGEVRRVPEARGVGAEAARVARRALERVVTHARENPLVVVAFALGVGLLVAARVGRR